MTDTIPCSTTGSASRSSIESDRDFAMQLGISFNGTQFVYRDFKYDKLTDAVAYAELDRSRTGAHLTASPPEAWLERPVPSASDDQLMKQYGISLDGGRYRYRDYRYDRLGDAMNYARSHTRPR